MFNAYTIKKMLPRLIIAVVTVNLSWYIGLALLDVSNVIGGATKEIMLAPFSGLPSDTISSLSGGGQTLVATLMGVAGIGMIFSSYAIFTPILVGGLLALFIGYVVLVIRQAVIVMLLIFSPLVIALWVLPGGEGLAKKGMGLFMKLLMMYPIIIALLVSGRIVSTVLNTTGGSGTLDPTDAQVLPKVLALVAVFAPYFMIPFVLKFIGGALGTIAGFANDRSRGVIDGLRKRGARKGAENRADIAAGNRLKGGTDKNFRGRINKGLQTSTLLGEAGFNPRRARDRIESAREMRDFVNAKKLQESEAYQVVANDDDKLWAFREGGKNYNDVKASLMKRAPGRYNSSDPDTLNRAAEEVIRARRETGYQAGNVASGMNQGGTGTGYNYNPNVEDDWIDDLVSIAPGRTTAGRMMAEMAKGGMSSGRVDQFGGGFAKRMQIVDQRREAISNRENNRGEVAARKDDDGYFLNKAGERVTDINQAEMISFTQADARAAIHEDVLESQGAGALAYKKRAVEELAPAMVGKVEAALAGGNEEQAIRELAIAGSRQAAAGQLPPQNARVYSEMVMGKELDVSALPENIKTMLAIQEGDAPITITEAIQRVSGSGIYKTMASSYETLTASQIREGKQGYADAQTQAQMDEIRKSAEVGKPPVGPPQTPTAF